MIAQKTLVLVLASMVVLGSLLAVQAELKVEVCPLSPADRKTECKDYRGKGFDSCRECCASHKCSFYWIVVPDECGCQDNYPDMHSYTN